ncbi:MAG TPA: 5-(carboxyamino)imidazole ribonucleotide synthase [Patescibacteria group bacterium]
MKKMLGVIGGGQLGFMLTLAANRLGIPVVVLDPNQDCPATHAGAMQIVGKFTDTNRLRQLADRGTAGVTVEIEHVGVETLQQLVATGYEINPAPSALALIRDKYTQHRMWLEHDLPTPRIMTVDGSLGGAVFAARKAWETQKLVVKTRFGGYDGRGTAFISTDEDIKTAVRKVGDQHLYLEEAIPVAREIAVIMYRDYTGTVGHYPVIETFQQEGICHHAMMLGHQDANLDRRATNLGRKVMEHLEGRGVFTIEMFVTGEGDIFINEVAPRVHNAGHLTVEGCETSQFEQHVRCVVGLPAGRPNSRHLHNGVAMVNVLGNRNANANPQGLEHALQIPGVSFTDYWKDEVREGRKMGHFVCVDPRGPQYALKGAQEARRRFTI